MNHFLKKKMSMYSVSPLQALRFTKDASRTFYDHLTAYERRVNMQIHLAGVFFFLLLFLLSGALALFLKVNVNTGFSPGWTAGENKDLLTE